MKQMITVSNVLEMLSRNNKLVVMEFSFYIRDTKSTLLNYFVLTKFFYFVNSVLLCICASIVEYFVSVLIFFVSACVFISFPLN